MSVTVREILTGSLVCLQCSRVAATVQEWPDGLHVTPTRPEHADSIRQKRCPFCGGRLWIEDARIEVTQRFHLTPADLAPKRGRPRKEARR